jgi:hypothetical protein
MFEKQDVLRPSGEVMESNRNVVIFEKKKKMIDNMHCKNQYHVHQTCSVLLHYDSSKRCVCPLNKFVYSFKVVKLFLKHPVYYHL